MKKILLAVLFATSSSMACMTGHWEKIGKSNSFTISLVQTGKHVTGKYCFITNNGNRIDCAEKDDDDHIHGDVKGGIANIKFESTFYGEGTASAKIKNNKLIYTIKDKTPFIKANMSVPTVIEFNKK
ncbi:hypothetical protein [Shimwellia blattae]|uniref:Lipoprotein n=1 Tax=Shimwellia blattae (strain ATCC 29907 / DSM 4481 / JCM 1650 / NBRC 105725 / CDC 9005-74) TaxID=630626 RepID=I2B6X7_SHIBC|nr:hypothetical protein [Shimwellia blattae]AFJ46281.1 hypothetical protein EBL_c11770 [Shimwellia blattae DSM 4481 = NBRC 105725]GAB83025.1 hypothetical protein EB105725_40_00260 [Shimwellia blattae DSM 4481 = NBRC 105725]VDY63746.1 Uncharacterised protein [Shimwellia blattae]